MKISYRENIPLYYQIESHLRYQIESGEIPLNAKLPPEKELCQLYGVSQGTLRTALEKLEREGLIVRKPAKGTFVNEKKKSTIFPIEMHLVGFLEDLILHGKKAAVKVLEMSTVKATKEMARFFDVKEGTEIPQFKRLKIIQGLPLYYVVNRAIPTFGKKITKKDLQEAPPLEIFLKKFGLQIQYIRQTIESIKAENEIAELLGLQVFDPVLHIHLDVYQKAKKPLELVDMYCPGGRYRFVADLTRREPKKSKFF